MNYERGRRDTARPTGFADMAQNVSQRVLSCAMCLGYVEGGVCVCMRARAFVCMRLWRGPLVVALAWWLVVCGKKDACARLRDSVCFWRACTEDDV